MASNAILSDVDADGADGGDPTDEVHPAGQNDTEEPPQPYGENNRELPLQLKEALDALVKACSLRDMYDRRIEVLMDRCLRFYDDGVQHFYPNYGTGVYQIGVSGGYIDLGNNERMECPEFMGAYNIFRARRRSIDAALTQNPPGIDFVPTKHGDPECQQAAEIAEGYRHYFDQMNDVKKKQQDMARMMELSGRTVAWTHTSKSKEWGTNAADEPLQIETVWIGGTLETRVPITCKEWEKCLYVFIYLDPDTLVAKAENDWIRSKITAGEAALGESDWERFARLGVKQARKGYYLTGSALNNLTTEMHCFFRPAAFEDGCCDDAFAEAGDTDTRKDGKPFTVRDKFLELFPDGAHVKYIGKTYSESWSESPDDAIDIGFPDVRDGMTGGALMEPMKLIQDVFNDYKNAERENYEKGWPATFFRGDAEDYNSIADTRSAPGQFHLLKSSGEPGNSIEGNVVYKEPPFDVPESFIQAQEDLRGPISQDVTGALPALQGSSKNNTASGQAMDRSQAMGMLGPCWANMQRMWAGIYGKAVLLASKNPDHGKEVTVAKAGGGKVTLHLEKIKKGTFKARPDVDSSFPDSTSAKRANLTDMLKMVMPTPLGAALMESPDNWEEIIELNGNPEIVLIPAIAYKKQMRELEVLLGEPPVDNAQGVAAYQALVQEYQTQHATQALTAMAGGQPPPPYMPPPPTGPQDTMAKLPSLMPEIDDFHKWESAKCAEYLSSEDCWIRLQVHPASDEEAGADVSELAAQGIENVRLHKAVHDAMMKQLAAQAMPGMPPAGQPAPIAAPAAAGAAPHNGGAPEVHTQVQKNIAAPGSAGVSTV